MTSKSQDQFPSWMTKMTKMTKCIEMDYSEFVVTPDSQYSCLMPWGLRQTLAAFRRECASVQTIIDATANIGCDAVYFCRIYPGVKVTAVEINNKTAVALQRNTSAGSPGRYFSRTGLLPDLLRIAGGSLPSINVVIGNCLDYLPTAGQVDLVYFDPPWCETPAADSAAADSAAADSAAADSAAAESATAAQARPVRLAKLVLGDLAIGTVVGETLKRNTTLVVVKSPLDYNLSELSNDATKALYGDSLSAVPVTIRSYNINKPSGETAYRLDFVRA